ncbi:MAG: flagellar hook-length control protein FliK [Oscillospiraceae bacterium]|jgi:flagellar hook-length control protein FliK|nr:flagellar hook-length control protein FliK [Oscillospiraceae bacterium]
MIPALTVTPSVNADTARAAASDRGKTRQNGLGFAEVFSSASTAQKAASRAEPAVRTETADPAPPEQSSRAKPEEAERRPELPEDSPDEAVAAFVAPPPLPVIQNASPPDETAEPDAPEPVAVEYGELPKQSIVSVLEGKEENEVLPLRGSQEAEKTAELARMPNIGQGTAPAESDSEINAAKAAVASKLAPVATRPLENASDILKRKAEPPKFELPNVPRTPASGEIPQETETGADADSGNNPAEDGQKFTAPTADAVPFQAEPMRIAAGESLRAEAVESPAVVEAANLYEELVERVSLMSGEGESEMAIQLKPEFLGKVSLKLSSNPNGVQIKISAEEASVKNTLDRGITALVESLQSKGVRVTGVDVVYTGVADNMAMNSNTRSGSGGKSGRYRRPGSGYAVPGSAANDPREIRDAMTELGISSVAVSA